MESSNNNDRSFSLPCSKGIQENKKNVFIMGDMIFSRDDSWSRTVNEKCLDDIKQHLQDRQDNDDLKLTISVMDVDQHILECPELLTDEGYKRMFGIDRNVFTDSSK